MVPTLKCSDVGDHICTIVYTTSYVRQILVGAVYYTARTYIGHDDRSSTQLWQILSYIQGGITEIGYFASWAVLCWNPSPKTLIPCSSHVLYHIRHVCYLYCHFRPLSHCVPTFCFLSLWHEFHLSLLQSCVIWPSFPGSCIQLLPPMFVTNVSLQNLSKLFIHTQSYKTLYHAMAILTINKQSLYPTNYI